METHAVPESPLSSGTAASAASRIPLAQTAPHPNRWLWPALLGGALFPVFFYDTGMGLNALCWTLVMLGVAAWRRHPLTWTRTQWQAAGVFMFAAGCVAVHGSTLATVAWLICAFWWVAAVQAPEVRQLPLLVWLAVEAHSLHAIKAVLAAVRTVVQRIGKAVGVRQEVVMGLLALPVILLFLLLYRAGSTAFAQLTDGIATTVEAWINAVWAVLPEAAPGIIFAACAATCWLLAMLYPLAQKRWLDRQAAQPDQQIVPVNDPDRLGRHHSETGLHTVLLIALNVLVLALNLTDIATYWLGYAPVRTGKAYLVEELYEGTGALVFSILLVMGIVLYQFRAGASRNPAHPRLLWLALVWLGQNALLVVNVAVRDAAYMEQRGLAYKRLLLVCFLILCLWGLWTLGRKIARGYSLSWLLHRNIAAALVLLLSISTINWDYQIARYNLHTQPVTEIDYGFLLDMHASALPMLLQREAYITACPDRQQLNRRVARFQETWARLDWRSWSWDRQVAWQSLRDAKPLDTAACTASEASSR